MSFLPGMMGILVPDPSTLPVTSLVFDAYTYILGSSSATLPADIDAGDLIVIAQYRSAAGSPPSLFAITDFTAWMTSTYVESGLGVRYQVDYKVADGSEGGSSVTINAASAIGYALVFKPNRPLVTLTDVDAGFSSTSGNPTAVVIPISASTTYPVLSFGYYGAQGFTTIPTPVTMSPTQDGELNDNALFMVAWRYDPPSSSDVSVDIGDNGIHNTVGGGYLTLN